MAAGWGPRLLGPRPPGSVLVSRLPWGLSAGVAKDGGLVDGWAGRCMGGLQQLSLGSDQRLCAATARSSPGPRLIYVGRGSPSPRIVCGHLFSAAKGTGSDLVGTDPPPDQNMACAHCSPVATLGCFEGPWVPPAAHPGRASEPAGVCWRFQRRASGCRGRQLQLGSPAARALARRPGAAAVLNAALFWSCFWNQLRSLRRAPQQQGSELPCLGEGAAPATAPLQRSAPTPQQPT